MNGYKSELLALYGPLRVFSPKAAEAAMVEMRDLNSDCDDDTIQAHTLSISIHNSSINVHNATTRNELLTPTRTLSLFAYMHKSD